MKISQCNIFKSSGALEAIVAATAKFIFDLDFVCESVALFNALAKLPDATVRTYLISILLHIQIKRNLLIYKLFKNWSNNGYW